ncbi:MAG TPA: hypothetical protein VHG35_12575 [Gemmatimonadales bacterium]|nr:hypothetical protein [Gemmatimonadales bacterium]
MFVSLQQGHVYLSPERQKELELVILGGQTAHEAATQVFGPDVAWLDVWSKMAAHVHRLIALHLSELERQDPRSFWALYGRFDFREGDARRNVIDLLHAYCVATGQGELRPIPRTAMEGRHNQVVLGSAWGNLLGDGADFLCRTRSRSRLERWLGSPFDLSVRIQARGVTRVVGEVGDLWIEVGGAILRCHRVVELELGTATAPP